MKWIALLILGAGLGVWAYHRRTTASDRHPVSDRWRRQQTRSEWGSGQDGVSWRWPLNKVTNEHAMFNRQRLRSRA